MNAVHCRQAQPLQENRLKLEVCSVAVSIKIELDVLTRRCGRTWLSLLCGCRFHACASNSKYRTSNRPVSLFRKQIIVLFFPRFGLSGPVLSKPGRGGGLSDSITGPCLVYGSVCFSDVFRLLGGGRGVGVCVVVMSIYICMFINVPMWHNQMWRSARHVSIGKMFVGRTRTTCVAYTTLQPSPVAIR